MFFVALSLRIPGNHYIPDNDGIPDYIDTDADGDGIADGLEQNSDGDVIPEKNHCFYAVYCRAFILQVV